MVQSKLKLAEAGEQTSPAPLNLVFDGLLNINGPRFPRWRHHPWKKSIIVNDTEEDEQALKDGYEDLHVPITANQTVSNHFWDLEDFSARQLLVYAKEEFDIDLPEKADQETLFRAVLDLSKHAPQNRNRLILMAHTVKMNYDETLEEIKRMIANPGESETETETKTVWL